MSEPADFQAYRARRDRNNLALWVKNRRLSFAIGHVMITRQGTQVHFCAFSDTEKVLAMTVPVQLLIEYKNGWRAGVAWYIKRMRRRSRFGRALQLPQIQFK